MVLFAASAQLWCTLKRSKKAGKRSASQAASLIASRLIDRVDEKHWWPSSAARRAAANGLAVDFGVESDRAQLSEIVQQVRDGRTSATSQPSTMPFPPSTRPRRSGKTIICVRPCGLGRRAILPLSDCLAHR